MMEASCKNSTLSLMDAFSLTVCRQKHKKDNHSSWDTSHMITYEQYYRASRKKGNHSHLTINFFTPQHHDIMKACSACTPQTIPKSCALAKSETFWRALDNQAWPTEWKTALLTKVTLCEYENQTLEALVAARCLSAKFDSPARNVHV